MEPRSSIQEQHQKPASAKRSPATLKHSPEKHTKPVRTAKSRPVKIKHSGTLKPLTQLHNIGKEIKTLKRVAHGLKSDKEENAVALMTISQNVGNVAEATDAYLGKIQTNLNSNLLSIEKRLAELEARLTEAETQKKQSVDADTTSGNRLEYFPIVFDGYRTVESKLSGSNIASTPIVMVPSDVKKLIITYPEILGHRPTTGVNGYFTDIDIMHNLPNLTYVTFHLSTPRCLIKFDGELYSCADKSQIKQLADTLKQKYNTVQFDFQGHNAPQ